MEINQKPPHRNPTKAPPPEPPPMRRAVDELHEARSKHLSWLLSVIFLACMVAAAIVMYAASHPSSFEAAQASVPSNPDIGNPSSVAFAALQVSLLDKKVVCGLVNYERANGGGWTGFRPMMAYGKTMVEPDVGPTERAVYERFCSPST